MKLTSAAIMYMPITIVRGELSRGNCRIKRASISDFQCGKQAGVVAKIFVIIAMVEL